MLTLTEDGVTVRIVCDTRAPSGVRATTVEATYHRFIHAEVNTHRDLSRNAASSRAIPGEKMAARVREDPAIPVHFGANKKGMQADTEVADPALARAWWLRGRDLMLAHHAEGLALGLHKQIVNRVIEPWLKITTLITATRWNNMLFQRYHIAAQPEFQVVARLIHTLRAESTPVSLAEGQWHLPYVRPEDVAQFGDPPEDRDPRHPLLAVCAGRCARLSYLNHQGERDPRADVELFARLIHEDSPSEPGHWSPLEHALMARALPLPSGNVHGYIQLRKLFPREYMGE